MDPFLFFLLSLVVWRISHFLSKEDGPFDLVFHLRKRAGNGFFGKLMDCFYCCSVWVALPVACWKLTAWTDKFLYWVALSGAACLLEQLTSRKPSNPATPDYQED